ncbi:908_t:CDS:2, partial [Scutellospora calospora]
CRRSGHYAKEKDYMNHRYFYKRVYYLAVLSAALQDKNSILNVKVEFGALNGDRCRPTILLKDYPAFNDACKLAKMWLHQRGIGGVDGRKKLANGYSSYQLIKGTMDFLVGNVTIERIKFKVQTTLQGIQGLKSSLTIINSLKVISRSPEFMNIKLLVSMLNLSNVKVVLDSDVKFDLLFLAQFSPNNNDKKQQIGRNLLNNFLAGKTNNVIIKGTTNSTILEPLREAFETLELTTVIPGLVTETPILKKAFFSIRFNSLFDKKGKASIEIFNPLNTVIRFLMIDMNVTVKDKLIGIINQKFGMDVDAVNGDLKVNVTSNILISVGNDDGGFM